MTSLTYYSSVSLDEAGIIVNSCAKYYLTSVNPPEIELIADNSRWSVKASLSPGYSAFAQPIAAVP